MTPTPAALKFAEFERRHDRAGLREALAFLLDQTDYRFIGIWRFQDGKADASVHYDRDNPTEHRATEVPDTATYCCFVRQTQAPFKLSNALADARVADHPARDSVLTYCGVPILDSEGAVLGTLCHYDVVPRDADQIDLELLVNVAGYLAQHERLPSYPASSDGR